MRKVCFLSLLLSSALFAAPEDQNTIILQPTESPQYQQYRHEEERRKQSHKPLSGQEDPVEDRRYDALQRQHYGGNFEKLPNSFDNDNVEEDSRRDDMMQD